MKRADVKAGVLYAVKNSNPVMVLSEKLWAYDRVRGTSGAFQQYYRPAATSDRSYNGIARGGNATTIGLPAMERFMLMMPNPDAGAGGFRMIPDPDPLRWEWRPTILEPKYALEPLDEYEAAVRAEQERDRLAREAQQREADDRLARIGAIVDVLPLTNTQRRNLMTPSGPNYNGHIAEVTLEWLEEVAGRLRQGSGCVEVH
jgi:hypothetical protein